MGKRLAGALVRAAVNGYALLLLGYFGLRALSGDRLWPVALASVFLPWLMLPSLALMPLMLWRRHWVTAMLLGVIAAAFVWLYGELFLPPLPAPASATGGREPVALTFMTYNVYGAPPAQLVDVLRASGADVIGLQEVGYAQADAITHTLAAAYPHQILYLDAGRRVPSGRGLLSRYPILEYAYFYMATGRPNIRAVLEVEGVPGGLTVVVAHPPSPGFGRGGYYVSKLADEEIAGAAARAATGAPTVLLGDFNTTDQSDFYRLLTDAGLHDAFRAAGWGFGFTWPARRGATPLPPLTRIDYVWYAPHLRALAAWVGADAGSDHLPVLARLAWQ